MPSFQFYLSEFQITNTRSFHDDTLIAGLGVAVNGQVAGVQVAQMGDFNNGTHEPWQHNLNAVNGVDINPTDSVLFMFQMYNNGHSHHPNLQELTTAITTDLATAHVPAPSANLQTVTKWSDGNFSDEVTTAILTGGLYEVFKGIYGGCDGIVVGATFAFNGQDLANGVDSAPNQVFKVINKFNGNECNYDRPCNPHGSNYFVTWIVQHQP